jgi:hypothetical protein
VAQMGILPREGGSLALQGAASPIITSVESDWGGGEGMTY